MPQAKDGAIKKVLLLWNFLFLLLWELLLYWRQNRRIEATFKVDGPGQ